MAFLLCLYNLPREMLHRNSPQVLPRNSIGKRERTASLISRESADDKRKRLDAEKEGTASRISRESADEKRERLDDKKVREATRISHETHAQRVFMT